MKGTLGWVRTAVMAAALTAMGGTNAQANHDWNGYHWPRAENPFLLRLGDNVSSAWDAYLATSATDWGQSTVINTAIETGGTKPKSCRPTAGRVEVCSESYGNNGWLGLAQIWVNGKHITQGVVKVNDFYLTRAPYNTVAYHNFVMCQETGHTLGLDHQDEDPYNANLGSCMDYTNNPSTNQHPNQHDYDMLVTKYTHLDSLTLVAGVPLAEPGAGAQRDAGEWGDLVHEGPGGLTARYERDLGDGRRLVTYVIWANIFGR